MAGKSFVSDEDFYGAPQERGVEVQKLRTKRMGGEGHPCQVPLRKITREDSKLFLRITANG